MDWISLQKGMAALPGLPPRAARLAALTAVAEGRHYGHIRHDFGDEMTAAGEYVPLSKRRPSVRSGLCATVVSDSVSLLFSEGHFPAVHSADAGTRDALADLITDRMLNETLIDAATRGAVGSVAILFKALRGKPFFTVMPTAYLTPAWDPEDPDELLSVTERYTLRGADLKAKEYAIPDGELGAWFYFQRSWTAQDETWFLPLAMSEAADGKLPEADTARSVHHGLGFVPMVWIRNLPGGDAVDGACTFEAAIDTSVEVDYTLSQSGRALKYAGDPKLVVSNKDGSDSAMTGLTGGSSNALIVQNGDAKLLEINGTAATAALEYVRYLRSVALEAVHGNRTDADKMSAAQSGRAMEMMNQGLIWLADRLRVTYGQVGLLSLLRMVCRASAVVSRSEGGLLVAGRRVMDLDPAGLSLVWPRWYAPSAEDRQQEASTLAQLTAAALMSREAAVRILASTYDVEDTAAEMLLIAADEAAADARATAMAAQVKATEALPA